MGAQPGAAAPASRDCRAGLGRGLLPILDTVEAVQGQRVVLRKTVDLLRNVMLSECHYELCLHVSKRLSWSFESFGVIFMEGRYIIVKPVMECS